MRRFLGAKIIAMTLWIQSGVAIALLTHQAIRGEATIPFAGVHLFGTPVEWAFRFDPLTTTMFAMTSLLAAVVGQYSLRYLCGSPIQERFFRLLLGTTVAVSMMILSSNLVMFIASWLGISWGLHRMLLLHQERTAAVYAARKKFLVSRLGDVAIIGAAALIYKIFGTFDFAEIFSRATAVHSQLAGHEAWLFEAAAVMLAAGAMTKSVQVPFHFWLPETMETPTPVSALMHAGIVNAGGFLVLRLSPIISHSEVASASLALVGATTAVFGALVMATQNSIKSKLAYSTISQMGLMMLGCGIHAYSFALFHIVAHSFYKAHAFLSTNALVLERHGAAAPRANLSRGGTALVFGIGVGLMAIGNFWDGGAHLPYFTYAAVLFVGLSQNAGRYPVGQEHSAATRISTAALVVVAIVAYVTLEAVLDGFVSIPVAAAVNAPVNWAVFAIFAAGLMVAQGLAAQRTGFARRTYMALWNGCYLNALSTRVLNRVWPA